MNNRKITRSYDGWYHYNTLATLKPIIGTYKIKKNISTTIKSITVNEDKRIVTVVFDDNSVRMSKCTEDDKFDVKVGVAMCIAYQLFNGSKSAFKKEIIKKSNEIKAKTKKKK